MAKGFLYDNGDELITRKEDVGGLPDTSEASAGDILSLDEDKEPVWSAPSGGGGGVDFLYHQLGENNTLIFFEESPDNRLTFSQLVQKDGFLVKYAISSGFSVDDSDGEGNGFITGTFIEYSVDGSSLEVYNIYVENVTSNQTAFSYTLKTVSLSNL